MGVQVSKNCPKTENKYSWETGETGNSLFHGVEAVSVFFPKLYLSVTERNRAKFQFEILPCQNDRPFTPHNARGGKRWVECVKRNARGGMEEATCEKRNARGGMAAYRNEKVGREKKVSLETYHLTKSYPSLFGLLFF
jgi:hypothetical protein